MKQNYYDLDDAEEAKDDEGFCPNCGIGLENAEIRLQFCKNCKTYFGDDE